MSIHIDELISAYIDNELTETERQQVEEHLSSCLECSTLLGDLRNIKNQVFAAFHSIEVPESLEDTVIEAVSSAVPSKPSPRRFWLFAPLLGTLLFLAMTFAFIGSFVFKFTSVGCKVIVNLIYALGSFLGSDPNVIAGLIGFSLLLIIGSSVSLKLLLKTKAIQGDSI